MKIKAAVSYEAGKMEIEEVEISEPKQEEVLVRIVASGICHTDETALNQLIPVKLPAIYGHEGAGVVEKVGSAVNEFKPGDKVIFSFAHCGHCHPCLDAKPYSCDSFVALNVGGFMDDGTKRLSTLDGEDISCFFGQSSFATYAVVNHRNAVKVSQEAKLEYLAPFGCGIQTGAGTVLNQLQPKFGETIAIFGMGTVGMAALMAAKIAGCSKIIAVGGTQKSLDLALELGATHIINRKETEDIAAAVFKITGNGVDYAIDTTGRELMFKAAFDSLQYSGTLVLLATGSDAVKIDYIGAKTITGNMEGNANPKTFLPKLIDYYNRGLFPADKLVKVYSFEDINIARKESHEGKVIKAVVKMGTE